MTLWNQILNLESDRIRLIYRDYPAIGWPTLTCVDNWQIHEWNGYIQSNAYKMGIPVIDTWSWTYVNSSHSKNNPHALSAWPGDKHPCALPTDLDKRIHYQGNARYIFNQILFNAMGGLLKDWLSLK